MPAPPNVVPQADIATHGASLNQTAFLAATDSGNVLIPPRTLSNSEIVSPAQGYSFRARIDALASRNAPLSSGDYSLLSDFVVSTTEIHGLRGSQLRALKNDVLNVLQRQTGYREQTLRLLKRIYNDVSQDAVIRDYALQHLASMELDFQAFKDQYDGEKAVGPDFSTHWQAVHGSDPALAATSMLHLLSASRRGLVSAVEKDDLAQAALRLAGDSEAPAASRATALQVCGQVRVSQARPIALSVAGSGSDAVYLRIAAIATLADLGPDNEAIALLTQLEVSPEPRLRYPAKTALSKISQLQ